MVYKEGGIHEVGKKYKDKVGRSTVKGGFRAQAVHPVRGQPHLASAISVSAVGDRAAPVLPEPLPRSAAAAR